MTTVHVTAEHIKAGVQTNSKMCPVALALIDAGYDYPSVDGLQVFVGPHYRRQVIDLPPEVTRRIRSFDRGVKIRPFSFETEVEP